MEPFEITQLREFLWNLVQDGEQRERIISILKTFFTQIASGSAIPLSAALFLCVLALFVYHPRVDRGSLWLPVFGLFGGTPKLYFHSRPASFFGVFLSSRRRRVRTRYIRKSSVS